MPHYAFRGIDAPDTGPLRARLREDHRVHIRRAAPDCRTVLGGPLLADGDRRMIGTLLVFEAADRDAVLRFLAGDPYMRAGLFATTSVEQWQWGLGQPGDGDQRG